MERRAFLRTTILGATAACGDNVVRGKTPPAPAAPVPPVPHTLIQPAALPDGLRESDFQLHGRTPLTLESRDVGLGPITASGRLFVRNNLPLPDASIVAHPDAWGIHVEGVAKPGELTLAELKTFPVASEACVLQCSGNGRAFFSHHPAGTPWGVGAAGCVVWTGVRVRDVVAALGGAVSNAAFCTATGGEQTPPLPQGVDALEFMVERSIPLKKALSDALLAWEMNGEPLPLTHGGPLRFVVPGYFGVNSVKYVRRLACTVQQSRARIQQKSYRVFPLGGTADASLPTMWRMGVKSWIASPGVDGEPVLAGRVQLVGVAFSGERGVRHVEVTADGGASWTRATWASPDLGQNAWRVFAHEVTLAPGRHAFASRATDTQGDVQPELREENERGYGNRSWRDHARTLNVVAVLPPPSDKPTQTKSGPRTVSLTAEGERGKALFHGVKPPCAGCHTLADAQSSMNIGPDLDALHPTPERVAAAMKNGVGAMPSYAQTLSAQELQDLAAYVAQATRTP